MKGSDVSYPKEIRVLLLTSSLDLAIGSHDLDFNDVVQEGTPHP